MAICTNYLAQRNLLLDLCPCVPVPNHVRDVLKLAGQYMVKIQHHRITFSTVKAGPSFQYLQYFFS